jgi:hypothetical protein
MGRPAHADEISAGWRRVASRVMRSAKNTPTDTLTVLEIMRLLPILVAAMLGASAQAAGAACSEPSGCPGSAAAGVEPAAASTLQVAQIPGEVVTALGPGEPVAATARVAAKVSDGRPAGALMMRSEPVRAGARASAGERGGAEQRSSGGSEPSSVWLMLFAGLAFAGFVVAKRSRG